MDVIGALLGIFSERFWRNPLVPLTLDMLDETMRLGHWDIEWREARE